MADTNYLMIISLFFCIAFLSFTTTPTTSTNVPSRLVTQLIHRDSLKSPFYRPEATVSDLASRARRTSLSRFAYLAARSSGYRAGVVAEEGGTQFIANISIGEPPVPQLLTFDTGSNLLWLQCLPCFKCFEQSSPIFDPSKSSSYKNLSCSSPYCTVSSPSDRCDPINNCRFQQYYQDGITGFGVMATEKFTFGSDSSVSDVAFGCGHDNDGYNGQPSGILGLGPDLLSLATHLGSKFSYCIGRIRDPKDSHSVLILGDGAEILGDTTPLIVAHSLYHLTVTGISVGDKLLAIDPKVFKTTPAGNAGVVIDSGTTITYLASEAYGPLSAAVEALLDGKLEKVKDPYSQTGLCYKGVISRDLIGFPAVTFNLEGEGGLVLETESLFIDNGSEEFCLAVEESSMLDFTVIGVMAQQGYNIGYDVGAKKISFQRMDCDVLEQKMSVSN